MKGKQITFGGLFLCAVLVLSTAFAQTQAERERLQRGYIAPEQLVSLSFATPFDRAISIFSELSKKFTGKIIFDPEKRTTPIGVDIESMHWRDAFERILRFNNLWYEEAADYIRVVSLVPTGEEKPVGKEERPSLKTREVQITAVFYAVDIAKIRESGISWSIFRGNNVNISVEQRAADAVSDLFQIQGSPRFDFEADIHTLIRLFESKSLAELIARPQVTVRSGQEGVIQVGTDFPINVRDFAGNLITRIEHAGTIIRVTPEVITENDTTFIHLQLHVERSSVAPSALGFEKGKTEATTSTLLLDGEETVIAGLYTNEDKTLREGVPVLKDLPWWFLGLRYIFGHNKVETVRKDLIILVKAELVPALRDRVLTKEDLLLKKRTEMERDLKSRKKKLEDGY